MRIFVIVFATFLPLVLMAQQWKLPSDAKELKNPSELNALNIKAGKLLYYDYCEQCHGDIGKSNSKELNPRPPDLILKQAQQNTEGELYYKIAEGNAAMTQFKGTISEAEIWKIVNYIRYFNKDFKPVGDISSLTKQFDGSDLRIITSLDEGSRLLSIKIEGLDKNKKPTTYAGVSVSVGVKRYFGVLPIKSALMTNDTGFAFVQIPPKIIGNDKGKLDLIVKIDDADYYGKVERHLSAVGIAAAPKDILESRTLWAVNAKTSLWVIISYITVVVGVWSTIMYVIFLMVMLKKQGKVYYQNPEKSN